MSAAAGCIHGTTHTNEAKPSNARWPLQLPQVRTGYEEARLKNATCSCPGIRLRQVARLLENRHDLRDREAGHQRRHEEQHRGRRKVSREEFLTSLHSSPVDPFRLRQYRAEKCPARPLDVIVRALGAKKFVNTVLPGLHGDEAQVLQG
eukprot:scaffold447_cov307-Pinguiococcus_pyrenoidosus.AAC.94